ncbi:hypothetical protein FUA48_08470 [Flavobacterium alkalisoli]|uniref:Uncharacterized protein n=1 Tax=Flavobacterium alkalisoli TaxID=2602769 RepID=A0A5B9FRU1_9FLAO|nr:hypothetical protein [Flavobacterium alkalisoli]QEE49614.1 hypothetical protein FUA48_08470 [Flavobacterium alkalisoli]
MNLVQQNRTVERNLPAIASGKQGLGLRIFGWTPPIGKWVGDAVRYVGGVIAGRVRAIPFVGRALADEIDSITEYVAQNIETGLQSIGLNANLSLKDELTLEETRILEQWLTQFKPYAENLTQDVANALALSDTTAMLTGLNAVLNKINAVQDHYNPEVTKTAGLSTNALRQRSYVIYQAFNLIVMAVTEGLKRKNLSLTTKEVTFPINQYNFMPLFSNSTISTVTGENYVLASGSTKPTTKPGIELQPGGITTLPVYPGGGIIPKVPVNTGGTPVTNVPTKEGTNTTTDKGSDVIEAEVITDTSSDDVTNNTTGKKSNTTKVVLGGLLVVAIAIAASKASKKKAVRSKKRTKTK